MAKLNSGTRIYGNVTVDTFITATGNITGGNLSGTNIVGTLTTAAQTNITSVGTLTGLTLSGNISGTGVTLTGTSSLNGTVSTNNILPFGNANANIGSAALRFNTVFAKATSAQYADLAEIYIADDDYPPGTVVVFGGSKEITVTSTAHDTRVAGVISTNPAYLMNSEVQGLPVALTGRVPCLVQGPINKGEVLVTGLKAGTAQKINTARFQPGCVVGKSIENIPDDELKLIEIVVGRF
jgi:hypothetical protein